MKDCFLHECQVGTIDQEQTFVHQAPKQPFKAICDTNNFFYTFVSAMKSRTIALQVICCVIGVIFISAEFLATKNVSEGGLFFGWLFFFAACILGADHTANLSARTRLVFKSLVVISALPFIALCTYLLINASDISPLARIGQAGKILLFSVCVLAIAMESHPFVQRALKKCGLSEPKNEPCRTGH